VQPVIIIKITPRITGSILIQVPQPGSQLTGSGPPQPIFHAQGDSLRNKKPRNDQGRSSLSAFHLKNYQKDWLKAFGSRKCLPTTIWLTFFWPQALEACQSPLLSLLSHFNIHTLNLTEN
jgi:hypothetical protein